MENIQYIIDNGLLRVEVDGKTKMDLFIRLISRVSSDRSLPSELKVLIDSRKAQYITKPSDLTTIYRKIKENRKKFVDVRIAVVQNSPYETALSMILKELLEEVENVVLEVFNTQQAAVAWLKQK